MKLNPKKLIILYAMCISPLSAYAIGSAMYDPRIGAVTFVAGALMGAFASVGAAVITAAIVAGVVYLTKENEN